MVDISAVELLLKLIVLMFSVIIFSQFLILSAVCRRTISNVFNCLSRHSRLNEVKGEGKKNS